MVRVYLAYMCCDHLKLLCIGLKAQRKACHNNNVYKPYFHYSICVIIFRGCEYGCKEILFKSETG